jgi:hypothetical protein
MRISPGCLQQAGRGRSRAAVPAHILLVELVAPVAREPVLDGVHHLAHILGILLLQPALQGAPG